MRLQSSPGDRMRKAGRGVAMASMTVAVATSAVVSGALWQRTHALDTELGRLRAEVAAGASHRAALRARIERSHETSTLRHAEVLGELVGLRERQQDQRPAPAPSVDPAEFNALRHGLDGAFARLSSLEAQRAAAEEVIRRYGGGVALIQGAYTFHSPEGAPLREVIEGGGGAASEVVAGDVHTVEYYGTGFLVDGRGILMSNRHIAEPWWGDDTAEALMERGYVPKFVRLRAFFPNEPEAFELTPGLVSPKVDLALLNVDLRGRDIPVLPLDQTGQGAVAGRPIVVLGYPTGLEALLAKSASGVVKSILDVHGSSRDRVTEALSVRGLIRPSATQGHIGDITDTDVVFDAPTTQGGSGGPLFDREGRVVAVEYAVLPQFGGNSFAVPISYALELLGSAARPPAPAAD